MNYCLLIRHNKAKYFLEITFKSAPAQNTCGTRELIITQRTLLSFLTEFKKFSNYLIRSNLLRIEINFYINKNLILVTSIKSFLLREFFPCGRFSCAITMPLKINQYKINLKINLLLKERKRETIFVMFNV